MKKITVPEMLPPTDLLLRYMDEGMHLNYTHSSGSMKGAAIYKSLSGEKGSWTKICMTSDGAFLDRDVEEGVKYYYTVKSYKKLRGKNVYSESAKAVSAVYQIEKKRRSRQHKNFCCEKQ